METKENNENQNTEVSHNQEAKKKDNKNIFIFVIICSIGILSAVLVEKYAIIFTNRSMIIPPKYWAYSKNPTLLKHVHIVLARLGYEQVEGKDADWDLLWSREYPFGIPDIDLGNLKQNQKVNHMRGAGHIISKVDLSMTSSKYIPRSFKLPQNKEELLDYAKNHQDALFVQKLNTHRGVFLKNVTELDLSGNSFAQEFVTDPFLIDGHKFDIGIYMVITSVNPLRIYWYKEDVLLRFCPEKYSPFDANILDKYVISDDYKPTWDIPSLTYYFNVLHLGMKGSLDNHLRSQGIDPDIVWKRVSEAISEILLIKEDFLIKAASCFDSPGSFFEMMRVDLLLDKDLNVHFIEANMSPNLVADTKPTNQLLYEQVLYNTFTLTGIAGRYRSGNDPAKSTMVSAPKNIAAWGHACAEYCMKRCDLSVYCALCAHCRGPTLTASLEAAHRENIHKGAFRRLFPPELKRGISFEDAQSVVKHLKESNQLLYVWYQGKCNDDITWCT